MSYTIIYDKLSVGMGDGLFMPIVLSATNKSPVARQAGRSALVKWWDIWPGKNGSLWQSKAEWKQDCSDELRSAGCDPDELCLHLGIDIQGTRNTYKNYEGLFVGAIKKSISYELLVKLFYVSFSVMVDGEYKLAKSKADFMDMVLAAGDAPVVSVMANSEADLAKLVRRHLYNQKMDEMKWVNADSYFVIDMGDGYFKRLSKGCAIYSCTEDDAAKFISEKKALAKLKDVKQKRPHLCLKVVPVNEPARFRVSAS